MCVSEDPAPSVVPRRRSQKGGNFRSKIKELYYKENGGKNRFAKSVVKETISKFVTDSISKFVTDFVLFTLAETIASAACSPNSNSSIVSANVT